VRQRLRRGARRRMGACCSGGNADAAPPPGAAPNNIVDELDIKTLAAETHCARPAAVRGVAAARADAVRYRLRLALASQSR
jgi:hypothetical protein